MKIFKSGACVAIMLSISALAHAQAASAPPASVQQLASPQVPQGDAPVTRAQVRHELVHAERDGQIQTLDRTLYAHH
ncbi:DUF4148 domain-containing protein [Paraburkholderia flagellata]|uniref:DUF4148 domain-containing protein n=1 Tax=Paraburkholderia flagellata TaxID=2883241 RepID=UPI001F308F47|nr:DUF4148 domain-containing protein [Paraburkholderia flagellata]